MNTKNTVWGLIAIFVLLVVLAYGFYKKTPPKSAAIQPITSFEDCAKVYPVMESYPAQCKTEDGKTFTQDIGNELSKLDLVTIDSPRPNVGITSPLVVTGRARGGWYFEGSFGVELQDANGKTIVMVPAQATSDWMTANFVPYTATLTFPAQQKGTKGKLILHKDNPSGIPAKDDSLVVPIVFN